MNRKLIYDLLMLALAEDVAQNANSSGEAISYCDFVNVASSDWELAFNVLSMHGVAAFAFDAVEKMPHEVRPPKEVLMKFISAKITGQKSYAKLQGLYDKIDIIIKENNLKCLLLKGLSLADYYPSPETRKFLDIDLSIFI